MDTINFDYSTKNIPIPSKDKYKFKLIESSQKVIKNMRWKAFFFTNSSNQENEENDISPRTPFKSKRCPPTIPDMKNFEKDLATMIENIKFKNASSDFQRKLKADIKRINECDELIVPADKTQNFYKVSKEDHDKILQDNVTKEYKKAPLEMPSLINKEAKALAKKYGVLDRANTMSTPQAFVTIKDHKEDFRTNPKFRLLNPCKSELGKISKGILQRINSTLRDQLQLNQWQDPKQVIEWFKNIAGKTSCTFTTFDVKDFYPSITEPLLRKAILFAKRHTDVSPGDIKVIFHCRKSLLYHNDVPWVKKRNGGKFDVPMGSYDGAEVCEIVGLYLLSILTNRYKKEDIGLYRDDGLAIFRNHNGHQNDKVRKNIINFFKHHNLDLEIKCNLKRVDYLDISFDLETGLYKPFNKPNNDPLYIHAKSNHPPSILKQIPKSVSNRLTSHSANEDVFNEAAPLFNRSLERSGYTEKVDYNPEVRRNIRRNRSRKIIWYNPPYSMNVETNVGRTFLNLIRKHFPDGHRLHKIFNKNTLKVSYSCMESIGKIIKSHNAKVGKGDRQPVPCNCQINRICPLDGDCRSPNSVYQAEVSIPQEELSQFYIGISEPETKQRIRNHHKAFNDRQYEKDSALTEYIWQLKDRGITNYTIKWSILRKVPRYNKVKGLCSLCIAEKLEIANFPHKDRLLNVHLQIATHCLHWSKHTLGKYQPGVG